MRGRVTAPAPARFTMRHGTSPHNLVFTGTKKTPHEMT